MARELAEACVSSGPTGTASTCCIRAAARVGGLDLGFVPGAGGRDVAGILAGCKSGEIEVVYLLGADELDLGDTGIGLCDLPGPSRRSRRRPRRRRPAGCRLHREGRHLRQHRGPRAAGAPRGVPARRGARGLGDPAGLSGALGKTLPYDSLAQLRAQLRRRAPTFAAHRSRSRRPRGAPSARPAPIDPTPFVYPIADFYMTDPISRACADDGRVQRAVRRRRRRAAADRHAWLTWSGPVYAPGRRLVSRRRVPARSPCRCSWPSPI